MTCLACSTLAELPPEHGGSSESRQRNAPFYHQIKDISNHISVLSDYLSTGTEAETGKSTESRTTRKFREPQGSGSSTRLSRYNSMRIRTAGPVDMGGEP